MKALAILALIGLATAAPQSKDDISLPLPSFDKIPGIPMANGVPDLSKLAGFDYTSLLATYGPVIFDFMTPDVTKRLAKKYLASAKIGESVQLTPRVRPDAKRRLNKYGPFTILGHGQEHPKLYSKDPGGAINVISMDPDGQAFDFTIDAPLCGDTCTILAGKVGLMSEDGKELGPQQGMYVHHVQVFDISKPMPAPVDYCGTDDLSHPAVPKLNLPVSGFLGRGEDYGDAPTLFSTGIGNITSGYHAGKEDSFAVQMDLVNYGKETQKVYLTFDLEYVDGTIGNDVTSGLVSVIGCKVVSPNFNSTGRASTLSKKYPIRVNGTFITAKGHMHNGGDVMIMRVNGKEVCVSNGIYENDDLKDMEICEINLHVKEGDWVELESVYDVAKHPLRKDASGTGMAHDVMGGMDLMGVIGYTFAIDKPS